MRPTETKTEEDIFDNMLPTQEASATCEIFCFAALADKIQAQYILT